MRPHPLTAASGLDRGVAAWRSVLLVWLVHRGAPQSVRPRGSRVWARRPLEGVRCGRQPPMGHRHHLGQRQETAAGRAPTTDPVTADGKRVKVGRILHRRTHQVRQMSDLYEVLGVGLGEREVRALDDVHCWAVCGRLRPGKMREEGGGRGEGELGAVVQHRVVHQGSEKVRQGLVGKCPCGLVGG